MLLERKTKTGYVFRMEDHYKDLSQTQNYDDKDKILPGRALQHNTGIVKRNVHRRLLHKTICYNSNLDIGPKLIGDDRNYPYTSYRFGSILK